jgi:hypothetical protein
VFDYSVFGLRVRSSIELPELLVEEPGGAPDVTISRGPVDEAADQGLHGNGLSLTLEIPDVARYRIEGGRAIVVDALTDVPERNVRLFLLGSSFGALLHQRGLLPLHANAIEVGGKAVAFMGASGSGKSTLAAWFHDQGYRVIADDVCVVRVAEGGEVCAAPGLPRFRLWQEALEAFGRKTSDYARSYVGDESFHKFDVPVAGGSWVTAELPLAAIYLLAKGPELRIEPMTGVSAAEAVIANTYRGGFLADPVAVRVHFETAVKLVGQVPLFRCERVWGHELLDVQGSSIIEHFHDVSVRTP